MDSELRRLIRLNEKKRQFYDGMSINPEEFSMFEIVCGLSSDIIDTIPISHSREKAKGDENN